MKESRAFKAILIVLAPTLVIFGGWRLVDPIGFYTFSGLELSADAGLFSEVRGAGGIIMASGLVVGLGAFRHAWSRTSVLLAAMVFLSLGLARLLGIALDGFPGAEVIQGMAIELALGGLALFAFARYETRRVAAARRRTPSNSPSSRPRRTKTSAPSGARLGSMAQDDTQATDTSRRSLKDQLIPSDERPEAASEGA